MEVVIAWTVESWYSYEFYRALRGPLLSGLQVLGAKKGKAFLSWYAKVLEFQSHSTKQTSLFEHLNKKSSKHIYTCSGKQSWHYLDGIRDTPKEVCAQGTTLTISSPFCSTKQSCKVSSHSLILYPNAT